MNGLNKIIKIIFLSVCIIVFIVFILFLINLTRRYEAKKRIEDLKDILTEYLDQNGEKGLLELVGIPIEDLYYKNEFTPLYNHNQPSWKLSEEELNNIYVYNKCNQAIVYISDNNSRTGSGFFISEDGLICTNYHVIQSLNNITVVTSDGEEYSAQIIGYDEENDVAVLKVNSERIFSYLNFSSSEDLYVGQSVYIIGNPFGYTGSISKGIISALGRQVRDLKGNVVMGMIQTDAIISFGNSGGPLLNTSGEVIGMASSIYRSSEQNNSLNFCLSSNVVSETVDVLKKNGLINRGWIDFYGVQLNKNIVDFGSLKVKNGILVSSVVPNGKAYSAGLKGGNKIVEYGSYQIKLGGDIITSVNGIDVKTFDDLFNILSSSNVGDFVDVTVNRNGSNVKLKIELVSRTEELISNVII